MTPRHEDVTVGVDVGGTSTRIVVFSNVGEQIEALRKVAGEKAVALIRREPNEMIMRMCEGWAPGFEAKRARELGFTAESSFEEIIQVHIEDELGGSLK